MEVFLRNVFSNKADAAPHPRRRHSSALNLFQSWCIKSGVTRQQLKDLNNIWNPELILTWRKMRTVPHPPPPFRYWLHPLIEHEHL
jgi:hypothetical protein